MNESNHWARWLFKSLGVHAWFRYYARDEFSDWLRSMLFATIHSELRNNDDLALRLGSSRSVERQWLVRPKSAIVHKSALLGIAGSWESQREASAQHG